MKKGLFVWMLACLVVAGFAGYAHAGSGGFRIFASDAEALGKGGAFAGEADNPSAIIYNPAGLTQLKGETHVSVGGSVISPMVDYVNAAGDTTQMRRENFLVPHLYVVSDFGWDKVVFGTGVTSGFGLSTDWANDSFSRYVATKTDLENIDNHFTMSYQMTDELSLGIGAIFEMSKFSKAKNVNQSPGADGFAQLKADDNTPGYTLSALYKPNAQHSFGLLYRSEIEHEYEGTVTADGLNNSGSLAYQTIFGGASYSTDFKADFTLPQSAVFGYSYTPTDKWRFNFDLEWMDWSSIESEKVTFPNESNATRLSILEALTATNRDWHSTLSYSIGTEYAYNDKLALRGGYFFLPTPIQEPTFDTTVTGNNAHGVNLGFGYAVNDRMDFDLAWTGMFYKDRKIANVIGDSVGSNLDGTYEQYINVVTATLTYRFP